MDHTILSAKNADVNDINTTILTSLPGDKIVYDSADSVTEQEYAYIPPEFLHTLDPSGLPLMLLRNLDPQHGLYNGTRMILVSSTGKSRGTRW